MHITYIKLTPIERELLLHRLDLDDCIAECLAATELDGKDLSDAEYEAASAKIGERVSNAARALSDSVRSGAIPVQSGFMHASTAETEKLNADILADVCDGSTFFANERDSRDLPKEFGGHPASWWARRHAAANSLEKKLSDAYGRTFSYSRY